ARRFIRIAYLDVADEPFNPPVKAKTRHLKIEARRHQGQKKALLNQESPCLPLDPFDIPPRHEQMIVATPQQISYRLDRLSKLRGVNGWYNASCVINGDDAAPGTPDKRSIEMLPLVPDSDEVVPFPVTINALYLADPT
ncbi:MAG TPA: hypothetical protein VJ891_09565, partial [Casimicrobiaceae bacterium]|nr:hypothetical protein [Casimicrobiaceae bacterium]